MRYIDSATREPNEAVGTWLASISPTDVRALRIQSGYFAAEPLGILLPVFEHLRAIDGPVSIAIGSNEADTAAEDVVALLNVLGPTRDKLKIGIVYLAGGIFHPKVIHVEQSSHACAYVGSANFTGAGIGGQNIEAGVIMQSSEGDSIDVLDRIRDTIESWFDGRDGLHRIDSATDVENLQKAGILTDKATQRRTRTAVRERVAASAPSGYRVRRLIVLPPLPGSESTPISDGEPADRGERAVEGVPRVKPSTKWTLVWRSGGLVRRDLNIPAAPGTNATGSIGLDRGDWDEGIDYRHYFRDSVFASLQWTKYGVKLREKASVEVDLMIGGIQLTSATMTLSHDTDKFSRSYLQNNSMTSLRWGVLRPHVAVDKLLGQILRIEREERNDNLPPRFRIKIDPE